MNTIKIENQKSKIKNRKSSIVIVALLLTCSMAQAQIGRMIDRAVQKSVDSKTEQPAATPASATAAPLGPMTPQQTVAQCPALPTVQKLAHVEVGYEHRQSSADIDAFYAQVSALRENTKNNLKSAEDAAHEAGQKDADRVAQRFTGHTQADIDKMSDADQEAMINNMLSGMGMGNMTDAMNSQDDVATVLQTNPELHNMMGRWREFYEQLEKEEQEVTRQIVAIDDRYATQVASVSRSEWHSGLGSGTAGYFHNEAERKQVNAIIIKCRTEQYTLWRNHTIKVQDRIKAVIATEVPRYDDLMKQHLTATGMTASAPLTPSSGYGFAISYLDAAAKVISLPGIDGLGMMRKITNWGTKN